MYEYEKPYDIRSHRKIITMGYTLLKNSSVDWNCPKSLISFQYIFIFQENMVQLVDLARRVSFWFRLISQPYKGVNYGDVF